MLIYPIFPKNNFLKKACIQQKNLWYLTPMCGNAAISGISYALNQDKSGKKIDPVDMAVNVGVGAVCGLIGGAGADGPRLYEINKRATHVMATTHSVKKMAQYAAKKAGVSMTIRVSVIRMVAAAEAGKFAGVGYSKVKRALIG